MGGLVPALTQHTLDNQRDVVKNERRQRYEKSRTATPGCGLLPAALSAGAPLPPR